MPRTSPARRSKETPSSTGRQPLPAATSQRQVRDREDDLGPAGAGAAARSASSRPTIAAMIRSAVSSAIGAVSDVPAVAQHGDPVGQREDLVHPVRDVDDRHPVARRAGG